MNVNSNFYFFFCYLKKLNQRFYDFSVVLNPRGGEEIDWKSLSENMDLYLFEMKRINFLTPKELSSVLSNFEGISQNSKRKEKIRYFRISEFRGQLEMGSENCKPHYNLAIRVSIKILASSLVRELSKVLYQVENCKSINVEVAHDYKALVEYCRKEETRLDLTGSEYYPPFLDYRLDLFLSALAENSDLAKFIAIQDSDEWNEAVNSLLTLEAAI